MDQNNPCSATWHILQPPPSKKKALESHNVSFSQDHNSSSQNMSLLLDASKISLTLPTMDSGTTSLRNSPQIEEASSSNGAGAGLSSGSTESCQINLGSNISNKTMTTKISLLQNSLREKQNLLDLLLSGQDQLLRQLTESVQCPVCLSVPRFPPIPCCRNGHVICSRCRDQIDNICPTCRTSLAVDCISQVAATIIQCIKHPCDFHYQGCPVVDNVREIGLHEYDCEFRPVPCPHWACDESVALNKLTYHVLLSECGDNFRGRPMPYEEEMEYARSLDDNDGNGFWRPTVLEYDGVVFYLQVEKCGKSRNWFFYLQMEGSERMCKSYATRLCICGKPGNSSFSVTYNGGVCPIDVKGAALVESFGYGLNISHNLMKRIYVADNVVPNENVGNNSSTSNVASGNCDITDKTASSPKKISEISIPQNISMEEVVDVELFKFWVVVNIYKPDNV